MSAYMISQITPQLVYIRWKRNANTADEKHFIQDLKALLDKVEDPIYFISDLRKGRILGMRAIYNLSRLTEHEKWAGSTAFSENPISRLFANNFEQITVKHDSNLVYDHPEDAIAFLERLSPGLTSDVNWDEIINQTEPS